MAFKPDRDKLNARFDGYKLGRESLSCLSRSFQAGVRVARLKEEDFSYQHVRAFSLCNHLVADPWDGHSVYWCAGDGTILRGRCAGTSVVHVSCIYQCPTALPPVDSAVNPSISLVAAHLCLFTTGCGSSLQLLHTPGRVSNRGGETAGEGKEEPWRLLEELQLPGTEGKPFSIIASSYSETDHQLDVATVVLCSPTVVSEKKSASKPPITTYHWHRWTLNPIPFTSDDVVQSSPSTAQSVSDTDNSASPCASTASLCCSLHSDTIALYSTFGTDRLVILSEADVTSVSQSTPTEKSEAMPEQQQDSAAESVTQENEAMDKEECEEKKELKGLGFEATACSSAAPPEYKWDQTDSDVTITVMLPGDVTKHDVHCVIQRREVVVGLTDGTIYFRGQLFAPINPDCSTWTIDNHVLEVSLEKQRDGMTWPRLRGDGEEEAEEGVWEEGAGLPQQGQVTGQQELEYLQRKIAEATKSEDSLPAAKRHHSLVEGTDYEECDQVEEEDATLFVITRNGDISQKVSLGGHQFLFSSPASLPQAPPLFCLKHNIDAVLWQSQKPPGPTSTSNLTWSHIGTFNALAYVQAARRDKKFTVCPPDLKFAALCDCDRHVFVYMQPEAGVKGNTAAQYVTTLQSPGDILGLQATDSGLVFVLKDNELFVIVVSSD